MWVLTFEKMDDRKVREAMEMLFKAKWNLPRAAKYCNLSEQECKDAFSVFCHRNPPNYTYRTDFQLSFDSLWQRLT